MEQPRRVTLSELARLASITPQGLLWHVHRRKLPAERIGGRWFVDEAVAYRFLAEQLSRPANRGGRPRGRRPVAGATK